MGGVLGRAALPGLLRGPRAPGPCLLARSNSGGSSWTRERTLVAVKPDGVQRRLVGDVIQRFERRGFKLVGMKMLQVWEGPNVVCSSRTMIGHTDSAEAAPGTIRGDFSVHISRSGGPDTLKRLEEHHSCQRLCGGGPEGDPAMVSEQ
uniref:nucleoside-diphosphate kinase n=1 Tax=Canis lupus familiaris TaxID=9615 RepID=A0A8P0SST9_CANLF